MKLPLVDALRTAVTGKVVPLTPRLSVEVKYDLPDPFEVVRDRAIEVRTSAKFEMRQISGGNDGELKALHEQAIRAMVHEVYGPITERLHDILVMLWEEGPRYDPKVALAVDELFKATRGDQ